MSDIVPVPLGVGATRVAEIAAILECPAVSTHRAEHVLERLGAVGNPAGIGAEVVHDIPPIGKGAVELYIVLHRERSRFRDHYLVDCVYDSNTRTHLLRAAPGKADASFQ
jgi:hypothetical protein